MLQLRLNRGVDGLPIQSSRGTTADAASLVRPDLQLREERLKVIRRPRSPDANQSKAAASRRFKSASKASSMAAATSGRLRSREALTSAA